MFPKVLDTVQGTQKCFKKLSIIRFSVDGLDPNFLSERLLDAISLNLAKPVFREGLIFGQLLECYSEH